ncbi:MAG: hypothetical protein H6738_00330 [Alphaproteobacteria bacterium]|nr:hypothetical protein [Alphaproteobacteria bacterium]MCB9695213.1 hypothetical protein [Alphaproteobacteria bacterium]
MILGLLGAAVASACEPWSPDLLERWVVRGFEAIDAEDVDAHAAVWKDLEAALPCLDGPLPSKPWAEFLVGLALVQNATGERWEPALGTALQVAPKLQADLPPPMASWTPPPPRPDGEVLPTDAHFLLDGLPVTARPDLTGLHVLQREQGGVYETRVVRDGSFPTAWLASTNAPPEPVPRPASGSARAVVHGMVGVAGGGSGAVQSPSAPNAHVPEVDDIGGVVALASHGTLGGTFGAFWDLEAPLRFGGGPDVDAFAGVSIGVGPLRVRAGGGVASAALQVDDAASLRLAPTPHVGLGLWLPAGPGVLDAVVAGGATPAAAHVLGRAGLVVGGGAGAWLGAEGSWHTSDWKEESGPLRLVSRRWQLGARVGFAWGGGA